jgi:hypothetical protein
MWNVLFFLQYARELRIFVLRKKQFKYKIPALAGGANRLH